jgi:hypothetical protein
VTLPKAVHTIYLAGACTACPSAVPLPISDGLAHSACQAVHVVQQAEHCSFEAFMGCFSVPAHVCTPGPHRAWQCCSSGAFLAATYYAVVQQLQHCLVCYCGPVRCSSYPRPDGMRHPLPVMVIVTLVASLRMWTTLLLCCRGVESGLLCIVPTEYYVLCWARDLAPSRQGDDCCIGICVAIADCMHVICTYMCVTL